MRSKANATITPTTMTVSANSSRANPAAARVDRRNGVGHVVGFRESGSGQGSMGISAQGFNA